MKGSKGNLSSKKKIFSVAQKIDVKEQSIRITIIVEVITIDCVFNFSPTISILLVKCFLFTS